MEAIISCACALTLLLRKDGFMKGQASIAMCGFRRRILFMSPTTDFLFIPLPRMQQQTAMPMSTSRLI